MPSCGVCPSDCPSGCLSRSCIPSKRVNIFSNFSPYGRSTTLVFPHQMLWQYSDGASSASKVGKNRRDSRPISGFRIDDWWNAINNFDCGVIYNTKSGRRHPFIAHRPPHISDSCLSQQTSTTTPLTHSLLRLTS